MKKYDYMEEIKADILNYIRENIPPDDFPERDELEDRLNDELFIEDSITGNGSGSYFCNSFYAEEAIAHNFDLLADALLDFGCSGDFIKKGPEACDVLIRCYILPEAIRGVLDEIESDIS